jgi:TetR/AcrR family transcriptional regulator
MASSKALKSQTAPPAASVRANVGRPRKRDEGHKIVPDALLVAADECVVTEASTRVPVRQIAAKAGVNQAMVNYYFSSKSGLIGALFEKQFSQLVRDLKGFLKEILASNDVTDHDRIVELMELIERNFASSPALFVICHTDMLDDNSETRKMYRERFGSRGYSIIARIMEALMKRGLCRDDISPDQAAYFICSTSAMPYLLSPIFDKAFASDVDGEVAELRRRAAAQLFKVPAAQPS